MIDYPSCYFTVCECVKARPKSCKVVICNPSQSSLSNDDNEGDGPENNTSIGNGVLNIFGGKTRSYQPMLQS